MYPFFYRPPHLSLQDKWGLSSTEEFYSQTKELVRHINAPEARNIVNLSLITFNNNGPPAAWQENVRKARGGGGGGGATLRIPMLLSFHFFYLNSKMCCTRRKFVLKGKTRCSGNGPRVEPQVSLVHVFQSRGVPTRVKDCVAFTSIETDTAVDVGWTFNLANIFDSYTHAHIYNGSLLNNKHCVYMILSYTVCAS